MESWESDLARGEAGLRAAEDAASGDLGGAYINEALAERIGQQPSQPAGRWTAPGPVFPRWRLLLGAAAVLILLVLLIH